jgi:hypothetical protein
VKDRLGGYIRRFIPERREAVAEIAAEGVSKRRDHRGPGHRCGKA